MGSGQWSKQYTIANALASGYVEQTMDGGFVVVGSSYDVNFAYYLYFMLKTDVNGNVQWAKEFGSVDWMYSAGYGGMGMGLMSVRARQMGDSGYIMIGQ